MLTDSLSGEDPLSSSQVAVFSLCPYIAEGVRELCGVSVIKALISFLRAPPHDLITTSPKAPSLNTITLGIRCQYRIFGQIQTFSL